MHQDAILPQIHMGLWKTINSIGTNYGATQTERRYIQICNRVSFIFSKLVFLLFLIAFVHFGWITSTKLALVAAISFTIPLLLNYLGKISLSRILLIIIITIPSLLISIADKFDHPQTLEEFEYFQFRIILLGSTILPFILFSLKEKKNLLFGLLLSFLSLLFYDPLHEFFGAGYYQMGFEAPNYYFINYIVVFEYLVLTGSTFFLKYSFEKSESENELLIQQLSDRQKEIIHASELMKLQREKLATENQELNREVIVKNEQLTNTNQELIRHNNELQQFSFTISHNLRGPVASLTGLINLIDKEPLTRENIEILRHIVASVASLDSTIKDLGNIIDIRNDISRIKQKLNLIGEIQIACNLLKKEINDNNVQITTNFEEYTHIYSVRPMLQSIFYNLLSNAIKYRSSERKPEVHVASKAMKNTIEIIFTDNGVGFSLEAFKDKVFGLYKRFHTHTEGKGLGLFLVKLQVEALDGKVAVASEVNVGSSFTLTFPKLDHLEEQTIFDSDLANLYYNANLNCIGINWKRIGSLKESKDVLQRSIDFIKVYHTPNWISNLALVANRDEAELNNYRIQNRDVLKHAGLKRIGIILPDEDAESDYITRKGLDTVYDLEMKVFRSAAEAKRWIQKAEEANS